MSKLYGYGAVLGTVNRITTGMRRQSDRAVATLDKVQDARAELATVVTEEHAFAGMDRGETLKALEGFASRTAAGRTEYGNVIGTTRAESMQAMFVAASSGIVGEPIRELASITPILAKAGQTDVRTAGKLLMEQFSLWGGRERVAMAPADRRADVAATESKRVADMLAKVQDSFATPGGLAEIGTAIQRIASGGTSPRLLDGRDVHLDRHAGRLWLQGRSRWHGRQDDHQRAGTRHRQAGAGRCRHFGLLPCCTYICSAD